MQYKNIVFDMGNVLTRFDLKEYLSPYVNNTEDFMLIKRELCESVEWLMMDRGAISDEEAIDSICKRVPAHLHATVAKYIHEYRMVQPPNPPMETLVKELSDKGYKLFLMSNTSHRFRIFCKKIKSIDFMDGIWISCEHQLLKPDTLAYQSFFEEFSLDPEECFFIDDSVANIEAAMHLGMDGFVFRGDVDELRNHLMLKKFL